MSEESELQAASMSREDSVLWRRVLLGAGVAMALVAALAAAGIAWLDTPGGHRALANRLSGSSVAPGITVEIGAINGKLWRNPVLENVALRDRGGVFLEVPRMDLTWQPDLLVSGNLVIDHLHIPEIRLARLPRLAGDDTTGSRGGWIDTVAIRQATLSHITLPPGPDGSSQHGWAQGQFVLAAGAMATWWEIEERNSTGSPTRDRLQLLVQRPQEGARMTLTGTLVAERNGIFARLAKVPAPIRFEFAATPDWGPLAAAAQDMGNAGTAIGQTP